MNKQCLCFQTRRPLEKVQRSNTFMVVILLFNLFNFVAFIYFYLPFYFAADDFCKDPNIHWSSLV
jgi:hypothetical protein